MRVRSAGLLLAALLAGAGCSNDRMVEVTGTVTVDGSPAEKGAISFFPVDGKGQSSGGNIKDGKYSAKVEPGMAKVQIRVPKVTGKKKLYNTPDSPYQETLGEVLPEKYNNKTELQFDVQVGKNEKNWDLQSK